MAVRRRPPVDQRYKRFLRVAEEFGMMSPLVPIAQFKEKCESSLSESEIDYHSRPALTTKTLCNEMGVGEDVVNELKEVCSPLTLSCPLESDVHDWEDASLILEGTGLVTLDHWKSMDSDRKNTTSKSRRLLRSKYTEMSCSLLEKASGMKPQDEFDRIKCPEVIITVSVFFPRDPRRVKSTGVDFLVLGSQKLSELRDKIPCALCEQPLGNFSENPDHPSDIKLKDICTSSLFLIENTFYNDMRQPSSVDLSKCLVEWSKKHNTIIPGETESVNMEDVRFDELYVRFGCPYVFLHLGDCEHLVIFKDIKLFNSGDCQSRSCYPITISRAYFKSNPCDLCNVRISTWVTIDDELSVRDPSLFCDSCFRVLHYDKQGNKQGQFIAFPRINVAELEY